MFDTFMSALSPAETMRVLDVGVTCDDKFDESNYFERWYPYKGSLTCAGVENAVHLETLYPGVKYVRIEPGKALPFKDGEFDIVFSNAVLEHTGNADGQRFFLSELCRVGKAFFVTTPYRYFPVEHHTGITLLHFLPFNMYRTLLRKTRYSYWADENTLNLLDRGRLRALFPPEVKPVIGFATLFGFPSNLVAYGKTI